MHQVALIEGKDLRITLSGLTAARDRATSAPAYRSTCTGADPPLDGISA